MEQLGENTGIDTFVTTDGDSDGTGAGQSAGVLCLGLVWPRQQLVPLQGARTRFGRSSGCEGQLLGARVSRKHCEVFQDGPILVLKDYGSTNGTHLNGKKITAAAISEGDTVRIGEWVGVVIRAQPDHSLTSELNPGVICGQALRRVVAQAELAAASPLPIVLTGETGTGKEVMAQLIHELSRRAGPLVAVNCAALPDALAEAELFGHRKGAFTGAAQASVGYFRSAHGGTILLDEVGDLDLRVQAKLLRVLQERVVTPIGETKPVAVDARILAAGQTPLADLVQSGQFRSDLYARLSGLELTIPPLRSRREEVIGIFVAQLKEQLGGRMPQLTPEFVEQLCVHDWPLNVRQVVQFAARMAVLHGHRSLLDRQQACELLPPVPLRKPPAAAGSCAENVPAPVSSGTGSSAAVVRPDRSRQNREQKAEQVTRLTEALSIHGGNVSKAAAALGLSRRAAYRLLDEVPELNLAAVRSRRV